MKADDREPSSRSECIDGAGEPLLELAELVVDVHAQRLESACRRVLARLARADGAGDDLGQLARARERSLLSGRDDGLCHTARKAFFSVSGDHLTDLIEAGAREPQRYGLAACRVHAHVERAVRAEAEPPCRLIELRRGHTEVEQRAPADPTVRMCRHERAEVGK